MQYTEETYQAFPEDLMRRIFQEYTKIGVATERWKSSFTVLRPDFGQKSASEGSEEKEPISQEELWKQVAASQAPDEGHTSALESTLSLDQKVSETEAKQEVFLGFTSKKISKCHKDSENYFALMDYPSIVASVSAAAQSILSCAIVRMD